MTFHTSRSGRGVSAVWRLFVRLGKAHTHQYLKFHGKLPRKELWRQIFELEYLLKHSSNSEIQKFIGTLWWPGGYQKLWLQTTTELEDITISPAQKRKSLLPCDFIRPSRWRNFHFPSTNSECVPKAEQRGDLQWVLHISCYLLFTLKPGRKLLSPFTALLLLLIELVNTVFHWKGCANLALPKE